MKIMYGATICHLIMIHKNVNSIPPYRAHIAWDHNIHVGHVQFSHVEVLRCAITSSLCRDIKKLSFEPPVNRKISNFLALSKKATTFCSIRLICRLTESMADDVFVFTMRGLLSISCPTNLQARTTLNTTDFSFLETLCL